MTAMMMAAPVRMKDGVVGGSCEVARMIGRAVPLVEPDKVGIVLVRNGPSKSADERLQGSHGGLKTALTQLRLDGGEGR